MLSKCLEKTPKSLSFLVLCLLVISLIETDGTYVSFWAEKPPNLLRLQLDAVLGFNFLGALTDAEITGCGRVEFREKNEIFASVLCERVGEAGAALEIPVVCWGWRQGLFWLGVFGVLGAEQRLGGLSLSRGAVWGSGSPPAWPEILWRRLPVDNTECGSSLGALGPWLTSGFSGIICDEVVSTTKAAAGELLSAVQPCLGRLIGVFCPVF